MRSHRLSPGLSIVAAAAIVGYSTAAQATTILAPAGGRAVPLDGLVACEATVGEGWALEPGERAVRPPPQAEVAGRATSLRVAPAREACPTSSEVVTLIAVGPRPAIDPASLAVEADAGRVLVRGRRLRGAVLRWRAGERQGTDSCVTPDAPAAGVALDPRADESCAFGVPRGLPADALALTLALLPAGWRDVPDGQLYDADGRRVDPDAGAVHPARVVVDRLIAADASLDVSAGLGRLALAHAEVIGAVDCADATCDLADDGVIVTGEHGSDAALDVRFHLRPRVLLRRSNSLEANPLVTVPLQRCPVAIASAPPLSAVSDQRVVVRVGGRCAGEADLEVWTATAPALVERSERAAGELFLVARVGGAEGSELAVTVRRGGTIVGTAHTRTRLPPRARVRLSLPDAPDAGDIDFIPTNLGARASAPRIEGATLVLIPVPGAYDVRRDGEAELVRGEEGAGGSASLRLAMRDPTLPGSLRDLDLASFSEPLQRPLRIANVPVALASSATPLAELLCGDGTGHARPATPGTTTAIPFRARDTCRLVIHRERLRAEDGVQALQLTTQVFASDGSARGEVRADKRLLVKRGTEPLSIPLEGISAPFDRAVVRLALSDDETHWAVPPGEVTGAAAAQWTIVAGTERFRLYATTAIPTGLFRVADESHSGILTLNAGALLRMVWLSREGRESPIGLEAGVMWLGVAGDTGAAASSHGQVAVVAGLGVSVPIANASRAAQTSISLHAWAEYEVSRAMMDGAGPAWGFVFGPSITIGDLGTNF